MYATARPDPQNIPGNHPSYSFPIRLPDADSFKALGDDNTQQQKKTKHLDLETLGRSKSAFNPEHPHCTISHSLMQVS